MRFNSFLVFISFVITLSFSFYGCSMNTLNSGARDVRVTTNPNVVANCEYIKSITNNEICMLPGLSCDALESCTIDLQNQASNNDADVVFIVSESGNPAFISMRAEIYKSNTRANKSFSRNSDSDIVWRAQKRLKELGYNPGAPDGIMGNNCKKALIQFQRDKGLSATGELNDATIDILGI